jgi:hypothetical protein
MSRHSPASSSAVYMRFPENETYLFDVSKPSNKEKFMTAYLRNEKLSTKPLRTFLLKKIAYNTSLETMYSFLEYSV